MGPLCVGFRLIWECCLLTARPPAVPRVVPAYLCRDMESIPAEHRQGARLAVAGMTKLYGNMNLDATIALEALVRPSPFPADQPMPKVREPC